MRIFGLSITTAMSQTICRSSEIAQQIADQLKANLSPAEKAAIAERPTADPVAYAFYTQAKAIGDVDDWEGWEKSLNRKVEFGKGYAARSQLCLRLLRPRQNAVRPRCSDRGAIVRFVADAPRAT